MRRSIALAGLALGALLGGALHAQPPCAPVDPYDSGGPLDPDESVYDARFYELAVRVNPADSTITGRLDLHALVVAPAWRVAFDLDTLLGIDTVRLLDAAAPLPFVRCGGRVRVDLPRTFQPGETLALRVVYGGRPRIAVRPPWDGGVQWARTPSGAPWIATSNQMLGADVWWPVKDHVGDKPDSLAIAVTVPEGLVVASNGRLRGADTAPGGWATWRWFVSTPISTYNVALNIAPYRTIDTTIVSVAGDSFPVVFYVLPDDEAKGERLFTEILAHLQWYERRMGPYPFRADKYGVAQTPHLGMEHQSIIAYGAQFDNRSMTRGVDWGFDALHHHELAHEWWGNLVTNADWKDMWIHEGFGTYMQVLWIEDTQGVERSREYLRSFNREIGNRTPIAPRTATSAKHYGLDIYFKGARVLHTLRWLIGDDAFFRTLRRLLYASDAALGSTDGSAAHFASTSDVLAVAERESGKELDWFFDLYLFQPDLPTLISAQAGDELTLEWDTPADLPFPMPVEVVIGGKAQRVEVTAGRATVRIPAGAEIAVDPHGWILRSW
jgi:aminopeptidase N